MKPKSMFSAWSFLDAIRSRNGVPPLPEETICSSKRQKMDPLKRLWIIVHDFEQMNLKSIKDLVEDDFHQNEEMKDIDVMSFKAALVLDKGTHVSERELLAERLIRGIHRAVSEKEPCRVVFLGCGNAAQTLVLALSGGSMNSNSISERVRDILSNTIGIILAPLCLEADRGLDDVVGKLESIVNKRATPPAVERLKATHASFSSNLDTLEAFKGISLESVVSILNNEPVPRTPSRTKTHPPLKAPRLLPKRRSTDPNVSSTGHHQYSNQTRTTGNRRPQQSSRFSTAPSVVHPSQYAENLQASIQSSDMRVAPSISQKPALAMPNSELNCGILEEEQVAGYYFEKWDLSSAMTWYTKAKHQLSQDASNSRHCRIDVSIASTFIRMGEFEQASRTLDAIALPTTARPSLKLDSVIAQCRSLCCTNVVAYQKAAEHLEIINQRYGSLKISLLPHDRVQMALNMGCIASVRLCLGEYSAAEKAASDSVSIWESMLQQSKSKASVTFQQKELQVAHMERLTKSVTFQDGHRGSKRLHFNMSHPSVQGPQLHTDYDITHAIAYVDPNIEDTTKNLLDSQFRLARIYTELGHINQAFQLSETVLDHMKNIWGTNHVVTLRASNFHSKLLLLRGDLSEAEATCKNAWRLVADRLGSEHHITLDFVGTLVKIYIARGRWREAHEIAENLVVRNRTVLGEKHPQTIESEIDFAHVLGLLGKTNTAAMFQRTVLEKSARVLGKHHPTVFIGRSRLASIYLDASKWQDAFEQVSIVHTSLKEAIKEVCPSISTVTARKVIGSVARRLACHHRAEAESMNSNTRKMNSRQFSDNLFKISEDQLRIAEEFHEEAFGKDHAETLSTQFELHLIERDKNEEVDEELLESLSRILKKQSASRDRLHVDISMMQYELSLTYASIGEWRDADAFGNAALDARTQALGKLHPDVLRSKLQLAPVLWCSGKTGVAIQHLQDAHDIIWKHQNEFPAFDVFSIKSNLANILVETGNYESAVHLQEQVVDHSKKRNMKDDSLLACQNDLAFIYQKMKRFEDARQQYSEIEKSLKNRQSFPVQEADPFSMILTSSKVSLYMEQREYAKAEQLQRELKRTLKAHPAYGECNKDTITCRYNLALILKKQGKDRKAKDQLKKALFHMEKLVGEEHVESKEMQQKLVEWSKSCS